MNEIFATDGTMKRLNEVKYIINQWSLGEYTEFTETQIIEICIGFTYASILSVKEGYSIQSILKSAIVACDDNRKIDNLI